MQGSATRERDPRCCGVILNRRRYMYSSLRFHDCVQLQNTVAPHTATRHCAFCVLSWTPRQGPQSWRARTAVPAPGDASPSGGSGLRGRARGRLPRLADGRDGRKGRHANLRGREGVKKCVPKRHGVKPNITEQCQPFAPHSGAEEKEKVSSHKCWGGIGRQPRAMYIAHTKCRIV